MGDGSVRGLGLYSGSADGTNMSYAAANMADYDDRNNLIFKLAKDHGDLHKPSPTNVKVKK